VAGGPWTPLYLDLELEAGTRLEGRDAADAPLLAYPIEGAPRVAGRALERPDACDIVPAID